MFDLPRAVWLLGWVSLATDTATEAIYPLLPVFLTQVLGAGVVSLGLIEGMAEAVNSLLKILAGRAADRGRARRPIVLGGYALSSAVRPLIALATTWTQVFVIRVGDRIGKGIRGAPRDAMLADWTTPTSRGRVFGFHRAMDHIGAILGPAFATLFLFVYPERYRTLFALTIIPGAIAVALVLLVREEPAKDVNGTRPNPGDQLPLRQASASGEPASARGGRTNRSGLPRDLKAFLLVLCVFTLGNSTDAFLLLRLGEALGAVSLVPLMWAALHVVKASVSLVGSAWSDRVGRRSVIVTGWIVYAAVYAGFAATTSSAALVFWFLAYGLFFGLTEGTEKALIVDLAPAAERGFAFGVYTAVQGIGALAASVLFGLIWNAFGPAAAFGMGAALAVVGAMLLMIFIPATTTPVVT